MEEWLRIRDLAREGYSIRHISRELGISRKVVQKLLRQEGVKNYVRESKGSKLDPYKDYLRARLEVADFTATRLFREITQQGYTGSYTVVKDFVGPLRQEKVQQATLRFETLPGQQAQADWTGCGTIQHFSRRRQLSCFGIVLGYSRKMYDEYTVSQQLETLLNCHVNAFNYFGGVPKEILYDRMKTVILEEHSGQIRWNPRFLDFARYYGFTPVVCRPYRAQTKGKIERPFRYIDEDFFLGREITSLEKLNLELREWLDTVANKRVHGTTNEVVEERFIKEKPYLLPLPGREYDVSILIPRHSSKDCLVSYLGNKYSVPDQYEMKDLTLKVKDKQIKIYFNDILIAEHDLCFEKGKRIIKEEHYARLREKMRQTSGKTEPSHFKYFRSLGLIAENYLSGLIKAGVPNLSWEVRRILMLKDTYSDNEFFGALTRCLECNAFGYNYVRNVCIQRRNQRIKTDGNGYRIVSLKELIPKIMKEYAPPDVEIRPLEVYEEVAKEAYEENR